MRTCRWLALLASLAVVTACSATESARVTWTRIDDSALGGPGNQEILSVAAGGPGLVAVGQDGPTGDERAVVWVSADGYEWSRIDDSALGGPGNQEILSVAAAGPGLVAAGHDNSSGDRDAAVWVSADGYEWSRIHDSALGGPGNQEIYSVAAGGPGLVAAGRDAPAGDSDAAVWVSADGYAWTRIDNAATFGGPDRQGIYSVTAGGPGLVAAGYDGPAGDSDVAVWVSADGYEWTRIRDMAVFGGAGEQESLSVTPGGPGLVAAGHDYRYGDSDVAVWVSADGYAWSRIYDAATFGGPNSEGVYSVVAGGPGLVAAGYDRSWDAEAETWNTDAAVWVSAVTPTP
jgi:hypothetical protein